LEKKPQILWGVGAILVVLCCAAIVAAVVRPVLPILNDPNLTAAIDASLETPTATPMPVIERKPVTTPAAVFDPTDTIPYAPTPAEVVSPSATPEDTIVTESDPELGQASPLQLSTEQLLVQAILPERDQRLLAMRLKKNDEEIPKTVPGAGASFQLGDTDAFWVTDNRQTPPRQFQVNASLKNITDHSYWWVDDGLTVNEEALKRSADRFENQTYPTNRAFFGSEWSPGVDNDVRVHIFLGNVPGVAGYFSASNSYSKLAELYSNEREMFFINLKAISPGNDYFDGVLAHEFQHMIHWNQDRNEDAWVNEGLSELATFVNGYGISKFVGAFSNVPDTQLTSWADSANVSLPNYGGSFLFMAYFLQRYGEEVMQAVVANPKNGTAGFDAVLAEQGYDERFNDILADFLVANYLHDPDTNNGLWSYHNLSVNSVTLTNRYSVYPVQQQTTVYQHGGDYIEITGNGSVTIEFTGSTTVKVVNNQAHSGTFQWYSHRGDETNTQLTRAFDLSDVDVATLNYWTWYDIEGDWDYGYTEISTDGGKTWTILQAPSSTTDNPSGNAFGPGYTGSSDNGPNWIEESIDLSAYTGQEVLIRFEYVTDDAVNRPGWTIDDINIPEIDFYDDVEQGTNGWQAQGFVRMDNKLPQRFLVQILEIGAETKVGSFALDETNYGTLTVHGLGSTIERAIIIVSGLTPVTTEPASYEYKLFR
jgi:hypothetical protein